MNSNILRTEENGIEYFTVVATGESGLSLSGMARSVGMSHQSVSYILRLVEKSVASGSLPESLKPLYGMVLAVSSERLNYKAAKVYKSEAWACIADYYAHDAKEPTKEAIATFRSFAHIGATSYIQSKTQWLPEQYKAAPEAHATVDRMLEDPRSWERMYEKEACTKAFKWYGAQFYWTWCYSWMTVEERCKLDRVNPVIKGKRDNKIHQYIEEETRDRLTRQVTRLVDFLISSTSKQDFETRMGRVFGCDQMELDL